MNKIRSVCEIVDRLSDDVLLRIGCCCLNRGRYYPCQGIPFVTGLPVVIVISVIVIVVVIVSVCLYALLCLS